MQNSELIKHTYDLLVNSDIAGLDKLLNEKNINIQDNNGNNVLHHYIKWSADLNVDYKTVIDLFLKKGIDINSKQSKGTFKRSALHIAVMMKLVDITDYLIASGAEIDSTDANGNTILLNAVMAYRDGENGYFVKKLIACGANVHQKNSHGITPLHRVIDRSNHKGIQEFFLNYL